MEAYSWVLEHTFPNPPAAKLASKGSAHVRTAAQIKFLYSWLSMLAIPVWRPNWKAEIISDSCKLLQNILLLFRRKFFKT